MQEKEMAERNLIVKWIVGSHLYGTNTQKSDMDIMGVCIPDKAYILGIKRFEQYQENTNKSSSGRRNTENDVDITIYSLPKFIHLLIGNNPNIIETLFASENCILYCNEFGRMLIDNVELFASQKSYYTFSGYAYSQERKLLTKEPIGNRKGGVDKYGFDTKFAYNLIRLYYEVIEILKDGVITLPHIQREKLIDIKEGKVSLDDILGEAKELKALADKAWTESKLQKSADVKRINDLQIRMLEEWWNRN